MNKSGLLCALALTFNISHSMASVDNESFIYCKQTRLVQSAIIGRFSKDGNELEYSLAIWQGNSHLGVSGIATIVKSGFGDRLFEERNGRCKIALQFREPGILKITPRQPSLCNEQGGAGTSISEFTFLQNDFVGKVTDQFDHDFDGNVQCRKGAET